MHELGVKILTEKSSDQRVKTVEWHQRNDDLNIIVVFVFFTVDWHSNLYHTPVMKNFEQER